MYFFTKTGICTTPLMHPLDMVELVLMMGLCLGRWLKVGLLLPTIAEITCLAPREPNKEKLIVSYPFHHFLTKRREVIQALENTSTNAGPCYEVSVIYNLLEIYFHSRIPSI